VYDVVVKMFTFAISSSDEFLVELSNITRLLSYNVDRCQLITVNTSAASLLRFTSITRTD